MSIQRPTVWPSEDGGNRANDEMAPQVDLLQMLIAPPTDVAECSPGQPPTFSRSDRMDDVPPCSSSMSSSSAAPTSGRRVPPPPAELARISGCYATCRACAEERYVRQQQKQQKKNDAILTTSSGSTCCRCPLPNKPASIDEMAPGTSGPIYFNYFRFAPGAGANSGGSGNNSGTSQVNDTWPSLGRSRPWQPKSVAYGTSASLPRYGGNGRRLVTSAASAAAQPECDIDDRDDYFDDDIFDIKRTGASSSKYVKRNHLQSQTFFDRLLTSASSLCCRRRRRRCCRRKSATDRSKALVLVAGTAGEPLDPKTTNVDDDLYKTATNRKSGRQDGPEIIVTTSATVNVGRRRSETTSVAAGERSRHHQLQQQSEERSRRRRQTLFAVGLLVGLFVIAASLLTGFVLLWPPTSIYGSRNRFVDAPDTGKYTSSLNVVVGGMRRIMCREKRNTFCLVVIAVRDIV